MTNAPSERPRERWVDQLGGIVALGPGALPARPWGFHRAERPAHARAHGGEKPRQQKEINTLMVTLARAGKRVVRLKGH
jgi:siroheme synthase